MKRQRSNDVIGESHDEDSDSDLQILSEPPRKRRRRRSTTCTSNDEETTSTNNSNNEESSDTTASSQFITRTTARRPINTNSARTTKRYSYSRNTDQADLEYASSSGEEEEEFDYDATPKWNCNSIRNKLLTLRTTPGFKITHWLNENDVNSNSYQRFMKLKGPWTGSQNQTYWAAVRYFKREEKRKKKAKEMEKRKPAAEKKKAAAKKKQEKAAQKKEMERILKGIKEVGEEYDDTAPIYLDCNDVRKGILQFLQRGIMTKSRFCKEIGNVQSVQYNKFAKFSLALGGASNQVYPKAYRWLDKLRIFEGKKKSAKRLKNERERPEGFPLRHDNGYRWVIRR